MSRVVIGSTRKDAGKTTLAVGLGRKLQGKVNYLKPMGDRLLYRKKQLWDHDSALFLSVFDIPPSHCHVPFGFDQIKLHNKYDQAAMKAEIGTMVLDAESQSQTLLIEGGRDLCYGSYAFVDSLSLARDTGAKLVIVLDGHENQVFDDVSFIVQKLNLDQVNFAGVVINKIPNLEDFRQNYVPEIEAMSVPVLGTIPFVPELTQVSVDMIMQKLLAKVLSGEDRLQTSIKTILVGAMSAQALQRETLFRQEQILVITSGDRSDFLLASLQGDVSALVLTNNVIPPANIISMFNEKQIPILLSSQDTYSTAMAIHDIEPLLSPEHPERIDLVEQLIADHVDLDAFLVSP